MNSHIAARSTPKLGAAARSRIVCVCTWGRARDLGRGARVYFGRRW